MPYLIDPPTEFDAIETWRDFLAEIEAELGDNPGDADLVAAADKARAHIAEAEKLN